MHQLCVPPLKEVQVQYRDLWCAVHQSFLTAALCFEGIFTRHLYRLRGTSVSLEPTQVDKE